MHSFVHAIIARSVCSPKKKYNCSAYCLSWCSLMDGWLVFFYNMFLYLVTNIQCNTSFKCVEVFFTKKQPWKVKLSSNVRHNVLIMSNHALRAVLIVINIFLYCNSLSIRNDADYKRDASWLDYDIIGIKSNEFM